MTPEHKALVERANDTMATIKACAPNKTSQAALEALCGELIAALSAQSAQPQAGEPVAWREKDFKSGRYVYGSPAEVRANHGFRCEVESLYASPQPANPAQPISVQDPLMIIAGIKQFGLAPDGSDLRDLEAAIERLAANPAQVTDDALDSLSPEESIGAFDGSGQWIEVCTVAEFRQITAAIGAGGQAVAWQYEAEVNGRWTPCLGHDHPIDRYASERDRQAARSQVRNVQPLYTHPAPSGQAVAVKPLEWREHKGDEFCFHHYDADAIGGSYTIEARANGRVDLWLPNQPVGEAFRTVGSAKAAAQADYERRILSALSQPHPADERVVEALRMAHSFISREYHDAKSVALEGEWVSKDARPVFRALSDALAQEGRKNG